MKNLITILFLTLISYKSNSQTLYIDNRGVYKSDFEGALVKYLMSELKINDTFSFVREIHFTNTELEIMYEIFGYEMSCKYIYKEARKNKILLNNVFEYCKHNNIQIVSK